MNDYYEDFDTCEEIDDVNTEVYIEEEVADTYDEFTEEYKEEITDVLENMEEEDIASEEFREVENGDDLSEESECSNLEQAYYDLGLSDEEIEALITLPEERSWRQLELVDECRHPDFESQRSFGFDEVIGYREVRYGEKNSQRPDLIQFTDEGINIRENKVYGSADALIRNIEQQTQNRMELFEESLNELTYVISPGHFTMEDAERIAEACYGAGVDVEWAMK